VCSPHIKIYSSTFFSSNFRGCRFYLESQLPAMDLVIRPQPSFNFVWKSRCGQQFGPSSSGDVVCLFATRYCPLFKVIFHWQSIKDYKFTKKLFCSIYWQRFVKFYYITMIICKLFIHVMISLSFKHTRKYAKWIKLQWVLWCRIAHSMTPDILQSKQNLFNLIVKL